MAKRSSYSKRRKLKNPKGSRKAFVGRGYHIANRRGRANLGSAPAFPASLFSSGQNGAIWLPGESTCFTDTGGTTTAGDTDSVARIDSTFGDSISLTQSSVGSRPQLNQISGNFALSFDGVDDIMEGLGLHGNTDPIHIFTVFKLNSTPFLGNVFSSANYTSGPGRRRLLNLRSNPDLGADQLGQRVWVSFNSANVVLGEVVFEGSAGSIMKAAVDGGPFSTKSVGLNDTFGPQILIGSGQGERQAEIDLYGFGYRNSELTAQERADLVTYLGATGGLSL